MRRTVVLALVMALLVAACGGSENSGDAAGEGTTTTAANGDSDVTPQTTSGGDGPAPGDAVAYAVDGAAVVRITPSSERVDVIAEGPYGGYVGVIDGEVWNATVNDLTHLEGDGEIIATLTLAQPGYDFAGGEGAVWVIGGIPGVNTTVYKIDPQSHEILAQVDAPEGTWYEDIAVGGGSVWVIGGSVESLAVISRLDPSTLETSGMTETLMIPDSLVFADGALWAGGTIIDPTEPKIGLSRLSPSGELLSTIDLGSSGEAAVAAGLGSIWLSNATTAELIRVDPATETEVARIPVGGPYSIAFPVFVSGGSVWVVSGADGRVYEVDPAGNEVAGGFDNPSIAIAFAE